jgi:MFS family permease
VRWLLLAQFLTNMAFFSTVIVAFEASRGLTYTEIFALESVLAAAIFVLEVPTGVLADRWGYRRLLLVGHGCYLASYVLFALAWDFWSFAASSALCGAGIACLSGCDSALLYESLPLDQREELSGPAFALLSNASTGGFFVGLATGSFLGAIDPQLAVTVTILPAALGFFAAFGLTDAGAGGQPGGQPAADAAAHSGGGKSVTALLRQALDLVRRQPATAGLSLLGSAAFPLWNSIFWYNQPLFARASIPVAWFGPLTAAAVGLQMLVTARAPAAERRLGLGGALALSTLLPGLAYLTASRVVSPTGTVLLVAGVVATGAWRQPLIRSALNRRIPDGARATTLSTLSFLGTLAGMGLNPLIGWLGDRGLVPAVIGLGAGLVLIGPGFWLLGRE